MKKILITNGWHDDNKGDCGIVLSMIEMIKSITPAKITILTEFGENDIRVKNGYRHIVSEFPDISIISSSWPIYPVKKFKYPTPFQVSVGRIWRRIFRRIQQERQAQHIKGCLDILVKAIHLASNTSNEARFNVDVRTKSLWDVVDESDIVISKGGSFIFSDGSLNGSLRLARVLYPLYLAVAKNKPVVLFSQSLWGLDNDFDKSISMPILKRAKIFVREKISQKYLKKELELYSTVVPDSAFGLSERPESEHPTIEMFEKEIRKGNQIIGLTVRDWVFDNGKELYIKQIVELIGCICRKHKSLKIAMIPQVTGPVAFEDDRKMMKYIYDAVDHNVKKQIIQLKQDLSPYILKELYRKLILIIGTRLHSVIFSLSVGVPGIAFSYSAHKSYGIMDMAGLGKYVFPIDDIPVQICLEKIDKIIGDQQQIRKDLAKRVKGLKTDVYDVMKQVITQEQTASNYESLGVEELKWTDTIIDNHII